MITQRYEIVLRQQETERLTLDALARRAGMHPALIERFVEFGLIEPLDCEDPNDVFDTSALPRLRAIGRLRDCLGVNLAGISVILDLLDRLRTVQRENECLRSRV